MNRDMTLRVAAIGCSVLLLSGCVMAEKYESEKARSLNFQRLLAQEEKRTADLDTELKRVKSEKIELEGRNREMAAQIQAVREQMTSIQEEAAVARDSEAGGRAKGAKPKKARKAKPETMAAPAPVAAAAPAGGSPSVHTVQAGETLFRIARQNGVSVQQLRQWNNLKNDVIEVGQQLIVAPPQP
ncbi:MAG: LysM peptidoglycan-binding domain-containing protein [Nitrospira sp.]